MKLEVGDFIGFTYSQTRLFRVMAVKRTKFEYINILGETTTAPIKEIGTIVKKSNLLEFDKLGE